MIFSVIGFMDLLGTIAFAISGALVGVKRDMDIFGINILAVITACGGGMTRDVVIGKEPPVMFVNPIYVLIAVITRTSSSCISTRIGACRAPRRP